MKKNITDIRNVFKWIASILVILMGIVWVYADSSFDTIRISTDDEKAVEHTITKAAGRILDCVINVRKETGSFANRLCKKNSRILFTVKIFVLSSLMTAFCIYLSLFGNIIIRLGIRLLYYIHNTDGKKEQNTV